MVTAMTSQLQHNLVKEILPITILLLIQPRKYLFVGQGTQSPTLKIYK